MILLNDNYLLLKSQKSISTNFILQFWNRLNMFLGYNIGKCPEIIFTSNNKIWQKYSGGKGNTARCFYDENNKSIIFWAPDYLVNKKIFWITDTYKNNLIIDYAINNNFIYIIPLVDIYHEMIHHIQFVLGNWLLNDDLLEATAESFSYIITGQQSEEYLNQTIALWYLGKKILKLKNWEYYIFLRDAIVNINFYKNYFNNSNFIKKLATSFNGSIDKFFLLMTRRYGKLKYKDNTFKDLKLIHNLLFYKY